MSESKEGTRRLIEPVLSIWLLTSFLLMRDGRGENALEGEEVCDHVDA